MILVQPIRIAHRIVVELRFNVDRTELNGKTLRRLRALLVHMTS